MNVRPLFNPRQFFQCIRITVRTVHTRGVQRGSTERVTANPQVLGSLNLGVDFFCCPPSAQFKWVGDLDLQ